MRELSDFTALKVTVASPDQIRSWSFGEVTKPETINYRTLRPEKDGLFAENIFGPSKDYECYCGKYKRIRYKGVICDKCGVEVTQSKVRRERMGHISLAAPVIHRWFVRGAPSKLSLVLDLPLKSLESVIYFASYLVTEVDEKLKEKALKKLEENLKKKKREQEEKTEELIKKAEKELKGQLGKFKKTLKNKEGYDLTKADEELKHRQKVQILREGLVTEQTQSTGLFKQVGDLIKSITFLRALSGEEYLMLDEYGAVDFLQVGMGAEGLLQVLEKLDLNELSVKLREEVGKSTGQRHIRATKRLRVVEGMRQAGIFPSWMVIKILPVLPPDLRPMVQLPGGRFASSDLNDLYRRVLNRNNRLKKLINLGAPEIILRNEKRMLQEAVDALIDGSTRSSRRMGHILRSLSDMLRGKQGRFRQNLLGKRVDYSGRSVIVVGPKLKLHQVGLPKEMALEMFKPFVLKEIIVRGLAANIKGAKYVLEQKTAEVWDILEEVTKNYPVLINRQPTLHRLSIQAFFPVLVDSQAIRIHPCICAGFNADFDGDQMAVHVPLSERARSEAVSMMMAKHNILRPASSEPVNVPNRDMALGCYYATVVDERVPPVVTSVFSMEEAILAFQSGKLKLGQLIKISWKNNGKREMIDTTVGRILFNLQLPQGLRFINEPIDATGIRRLVMRAFNLVDIEEVAKLIDNIKDFGFWGATISGVSLGVFDNIIIAEKTKLIAQGDKEVAEVEGNFQKGLITNEERRAWSEEIWTRIGNEIARKTFGTLTPRNPINIITKSGSSRASSDQIKQLSGMRGFSVDPTGKIVELPTKSNYREGLSVFEYFNSARGGRKGLTDRALKTADAGYLTRRLVDATHDVIVRLEECSDERGLILPAPLEEGGGAWNSRFLGRRLSAKLVNPKTKKIITSANGFLDENRIKEAMEAKVSQISVFSPLSCKAKYGICAKCYGWDFTTRQPIKVGVPVGVIAAQSIGEPGTQLTMRTFHTGGVAGASDITAGLPRVEELFEARTPKNVAPISDIAGRVEVLEGEEGLKVRVRTTTKPYEEREYLVPAAAQLLVEDKQLIAAGTQLMVGYVDIKEIVRVKGLREAQRYIVEEARKVYATQVPINERHFEVVVKKMSDKVRIESQGDTQLLPGEVVDKVRFEEENQKVLAEGGEPATASVVILGITRVSLQTESYLSAASFQETTTVLADAAIQGKVDRLLGLKENVIIGRLVPTSPERAKIG